MEYINPWIYLGEVFDSDKIEDHIGFVYVILNKETNRRYIGKKLFHFQKTRQVNKKKKRYKVESDWKEYYGSNRELLEDVAKSKPENFERHIMRLCKAKGEMSYMEAKYQFDFGVLMSNDWYNSIIQCRINKKHVKGPYYDNERRSKLPDQTAIENP